MQVRARSALAAALALQFVLAFTISADSRGEGDERRTIAPTPSDLAAFQLGPELDVVHDDGVSFGFRFSGVGMFAASSADLVTTEWGLSEGLAEGNPAASQRALRIATHVAGPAVVYYATQRLEREGRARLALALRISLMVAYSYAAVHNTRLITSSP